MPKIRGPCSLPGCEDPHYSRGYCSKHYQRWRRHGSAEPEDFRERFTDAESAFDARTERQGDCLIWFGSRTAAGYGVITHNGERLTAHHYAWVRAGRGEVPEGMFLDHVCHNTSCVEVTHLRVATRSQNNANRSGPQANGSSGYRGVTWHRKSGKWMSRCSGKYLGLFEDPEEAAAVSAAVRKEMYGEFAGN